MTTTSAEDVPLKDPTSADAVMQNAAALRDLLVEEADAIESGTRLTERAAAAMRRAGVFSMGFPASRGGVEMTLEQQVEVVAYLSAIDASCGWNAGILNAGGFYAGRLSSDAFDDLYPSTDCPTAGSFHPRGRAEQVDGGYLITGNWDWGSGSYTAQHVVGGCLAFDSAGEPLIGENGDHLLLGAWLPPDAIEPLHNWQTLGVRGSGSTSFRIAEPTFVPSEHTFDREAPPVADTDPLNKHVTACHYGLTGVVLGIARHAVNLAGEHLRQRGGNAGPNAATMQALGQAIGEVDFAYAGVREIARLTDEVLFADGQLLTPFQEARMEAANGMAAQAMRRVLPVCVDLTGSGFIMDGDPMQRVMRDGFAALAHIGTRPLHLGIQAGAALDDPTLTGFTIADDPADGGFRKMGRP